MKKSVFCLGAILFILAAFWSAAMAGPCILFEKQVSVNGGREWFDADTAQDAPVLPSGNSVLYRFVIRNCSSTPFTDVVITDDALGIYAASVGPLAGGTSMTVDKSLLQELEQEVTCSEPEEYQNVAFVTG